MFFFDMRYLMFMLPAMILMAGVQWYVSSAYKKWNQIPVRSGLTGAQAAQRLISRGRLYEVKIEGIRGNLTDHYDPRNKILALSQGVNQNSSVASLAITAHELGHAMQDKEGYGPLRLRAALIPAVKIGSYLGWILILLGMLLRFTELAWLGVIVFSGGALFSLATIPVELNASARAKRLLTETGLVMSE